MCIVCVPGTYESQKRVLDILEPKLQVAVIHYLGAGNWTQGLCRNNNCFFSAELPLHSQFVI